METLQKPNETYSLMTIKQLQDQYRPIGFDIQSFFGTMLNRKRSTPLQLHDTDSIVVLSSELMSKLSGILNDYLLTPHKSHVVIDYVLFSLLFDLSAQMTPRLEKLILPLKNALFGTESLSDRWEYCIKQTDIAFGYALGALYVRAVFGEHDRAEANEVIRTIRQSFGENLDTLSWVDPPTKGEAKKKLEKIYEKVGYPDFIRNSAELNQRFVGVERRRETQVHFI